MHVIHILIDVLWVLSAALELVISVAVMKGQLARKYPCFLAYIFTDACFSLTLFALAKLPWISGPVYWRFYIPRLILGGLLQFCVIYEVFERVFTSRALSERFGMAAYRWSFLSFFLMGLGFASLTDTHETDYIFAVMHRLQQTAYFVQVGLLVSLFVISAFLKLPWRNLAFGIALGMGVNAAVNLSGAAIKTQFDLGGNPWINVATVGGYAICVLVWMFYLWLPERVQTAAPKLPEHDLEVWNEELQRLASR